MLSVILPTYNEAENVRNLIPAIKKALYAIPHEIIVVDDDSPDETWKIAYEFDVRIKRRRGVRGLASAVIEGFTMAKGDVFIVMDADGQHDPKLLPEMYRAVGGVTPPDGRGLGGGDKSYVYIAVASRYISGGSISDWRGYRRWGSKIVTCLAKILCPRSVTDPLSGYFAIDRALFESIKGKLRPMGFKILLEILAHLPFGVRIREVPLQFGLRSQGKSKLSLKVQWEFCMQFLSLLLRTVRGQFALFCLIVFIITFATIPHLWALRLMYLDADIRSNVQKRIEEFSDIKGWLLSDISLTNVTRQSARILHRSHVRGPDPSGECITLQIDSDYFRPCSDS